MTKKRFLLAAVFAALCDMPVSAQNPAASPVASPAATPDLEQRMSKVEGNIDQILQLLKQGQAPSSAQTTTATNTPAASAPSAAAAPAQQQTAPPPALKTEPGAMLEVWTLAPGFQGDAPAGRSIGTFIDKGPYFELANFAAQKDFEGMRNNHVALKWSGIFNAKEAGVYVFSIEMNKTGPSWRGNTFSAGPWIAELALNGQAVFRESPNCGASGTLTHAASGDVDLRPGLYTLSLLTFVKPDTVGIGSWDYSTLKIAVKVRGPSDNLPVPLIEDNLRHKTN